MPTVWGRADSINVQKVLWLRAELGLSFRRIDAGRTFGVTQTPEYLRLNPEPSARGPASLAPRFLAR
ncbi:hypothetical protein [Salinarimonas soli]|uniref:Uncharacterized protein n=1 Tax=Salinarimonas soli TaxID=1638099 RepID=A0A5B2V9F5_9HYPH|nr:hypothetical protein [Salinarimonas soli]KAA2234867.1 hypothetical protein F0L46_22480 [Salinarimonas soli]